MNILLIYPETPSTFYSFRNALKFISKRSAEPPLGLLTVAAMLPEDWDKKLIDMNVSRLKDEHIRWADYVFLSGMSIHRLSFQSVVKRCNQLGVKVVAGGPMVTTDHESFLGVDHFVLNEAEITLPMFLEDLRDGHPRAVYTTPDFPDISATPIPQWELLELKRYANMSIQYSRGCPFNCEFCSITMLNGHRPRTKNREQFLDELESLYRLGWRGGVFVVDDNFIGNKKKLKSEILPAMIEWAGDRGYPFKLVTEASINLADDEDLMRLMVQAGFRETFIGIETPHDASLAECGKSQNQQRNLVDSVKKLQRHGLMVSGGFIVGFDHDPSDIFERQVSFIQKSGIVTAMVGLLNAPLGTRLFRRLKSENRLINATSGDNMDGTMNFLPKMNYQKLMAGYKQILEKIYSQKTYYERVKTFLREYRPGLKTSRMPTFSEIKAFFRSLWVLGVLERGRKYYWKLFFLSLLKYPKRFPLVMTMSIYGFHFRRTIEKI